MNQKDHADQPSPRVCQRGVDGSEGCGHDEYAPRIDGICQAFIGAYGKCLHTCDFSPPIEAENLTLAERVELTDLRSLMDLHSLGDRPTSIAADKLGRLIELEGKECEKFSPPIEQVETNLMAAPVHDAAPKNDFREFLREQMRDSEFAKAYSEVSAEVEAGLVVRKVGADESDTHDPTCSRWFHYGKNDIRYIPDKPCSCGAVHKVASESLNESTRQQSNDLADGIFAHSMPGDPETLAQAIEKMLSESPLYIPIPQEPDDFCAIAGDCAACSYPDNCICEHHAPANKPLCGAQCDNCEPPCKCFLVPNHDDNHDHACQFRESSDEITPTQPIPPPARVWINLPDNQVNSRASVFEHKHFDDDIAYAHLPPIQEALEACEVIETVNRIVLTKSHWNALVAAIKGETK